MKYVVKTGDSLSKIGSNYGVSWASIASANGIIAPYVIRPGQTLEIPIGGSALPVYNNPQPYNGQPLSYSANTGKPADFSSPLSLVVNGVILYGIFRVLMKVF